MAATTPCQIFTYTAKSSGSSREILFAPAHRLLGNVYEGGLRALSDGI